MLRADPARGTSPNVNLRAILWVLVWWAGGLVVAGPVALLLLFATQSDARTAAVFSAILIPAAVLVFFVLRMAFRETARLVRYRSVQLRLETCPAVLGGPLSGAVAGATGVLHEAMSFRLVCRSLAGGEGDDHLFRAIDLPAQQWRQTQSCVDAHSGDVGRRGGGRIRGAGVRRSGSLVRPGRSEHSFTP